MKVSEKTFRAMEDVVKYGKKMLDEGLTSGSGGNISVFLREENIVIITPGGLEYTEMCADDIAVLDGEGNILKADFEPSSELGFHLAIYRTRNDVSAVVHTHSPYATTFACLRMEIPAVHYLVGFAGKSVPVAPYATFGTEELAYNVAEYISCRNAVLMANHGLVSAGSDLASAFNVAREIEFTARIYHQSLDIGRPFILDDCEMSRIIEKFETYGKTAKNESDSNY